MFSGDSFLLSDIKTPESGENMEQKNLSIIPTIDNLKSRLQDIFTIESPDADFAKEIISETTSSESSFSHSITLEDGTIVNLPDTKTHECCSKADDNDTIYSNEVAQESETNGCQDNDAEANDAEANEQDIEKVLVDYFNDLKEKSECPDTIPDKPFDQSDLKKLTPEENSEMRDEFDDKKAQLKKEWEEENGRPWPKYEHDVYSSNGKLIRKAGSDYDAHHIQPLGMGGKNEANNITPLNAEVHYDKQGVHAPNSPYSRMDKILGGIGE